MNRLIHVGTGAIAGALVLFLIGAVLVAGAGRRSRRDGTQRPDVTAVRDDALRATVRVSGASGSIVGRLNDSLIILTARHVGPGQVSLWPHDEWSGEAKLIAEHPHADMVLLRLPYHRTPPGCFRIAKNDSRAANLSVGFPNSGDLVCLPQRVLETTNIGGFNGRFYLTSSMTPPGCSGGPLVDSAGEVVGVCYGYQGNRGLFGSLQEVHALCRIAGLAWLYE